MRLQPGQTVEMVDARQRRLGRVALASTAGELLEGTFTPGSDYPAVEPLFRTFEKAADSQALSAVDRIEAEIAALGLQLCSQDGAWRVAVHDVQIWADGGFSCRPNAPANLPLNGNPPSNRSVPVESRQP